MPIYTHKYIRERAQELIGRFGITRPPVDVREIAERLGLEIVEMTQDTWFFGMLLSFHDEFYIVVNKLLSEPRKRFAIAHEIGHFQLHRADMSYTREKTKEYVHREADVFAAELCMPAKMVKRQSAEWYNDYRMLAKIFEVAEAAMYERMNELGLVRRIGFGWNSVDPRRV